MTDSRAPSLPEQRIAQLRKSVRGYRELEKVAAEFRGRAAMALSAREIREEMVT